MLQGLWRIVALLAAPIVLASGTPTGLDPLHLAGLVLLALLGMVPLLPVLGARVAARKPLVTALSAAGLAVGLLLTPPGAFMLQSDLALGGLVGALAVGLFVAASAAR